ncbi:MAG: RecX family transcriptional regulator [Taibaiella sp.]|nr:RecX family transcriptional regulator [Taibaiella sp.]
MSVKDSIFRYCQYQPRCHKEVRNKLYELGCTTPEVEEQLTYLVQSGLLNEENYARAVARGKFRMKQWGRRKIVEQLKMQQVSDYCIKKALAEIDEDEYLQTLKTLAEKKLKELKSERNIFIRKQKMYRYLIQKGYESGLANETINEILKK